MAVLLLWMGHFLIFHIRRIRRKYVENENIKIKELVTPANKPELPSLMSMTKQSMLFALPMVAMIDSDTEEEIIEDDKVPFIGKNVIKGEPDQGSKWDRSKWDRSKWNPEPDDSTRDRKRVGENIIQRNARYVSKRLSIQRFLEFSAAFL